MKKLLIISPHWPPVNAPDMQRVRMSLPYYQASGWEVTVLTVAPQFVEAEQDTDLVETIPPNIRVIQVGALPYRLTRIFGVGNLLLRAWPMFFHAGNKLLNQEKFDLVFFSTTLFLAFAMGPLWKKRWNVPYVLDLQDPWQTDYYERMDSRKPPGGWKYQFARLLAGLLEGPCYKNASGFISVSEDYYTDLERKYPWFRKKPHVTIKFGVSPKDFMVAKKSQSQIAWKPRDILRIVYTGAAGPIMPHALNVLFQAFSDYRTQFPGKAARIHFYFIGTSYAARNRAVLSVQPIAENYGLGRQMTEIPYRIGHIESLRVQEESDALLILGSSDLAYSPSKIYPYFWSRKPMLGVVFQNSVLEKTLAELRCATLAVFEKSHDAPSARLVIQNFFDAALQGTLSLPASRNEAFFHEQYLVESLTVRQVEFFNSVLKSITS